MHASSESGLLCSSSGASASGRLWIGHTVCPVFASCSTMWRWLNVPRSVSCPVSRIGVPSVSSDANASASPCAQSMPEGRGEMRLFLAGGFTPFAAPRGDARAV